MYPTKGTELVLRRRRRRGGHSPRRRAALQGVQDQDGADRGHRRRAAGHELRQLPADLRRRAGALQVGQDDAQPARARRRQPGRGGRNERRKHAGSWSTRSPASRGTCASRPRPTPTAASRSAYSSGTMVRGIEIILRGRDPRDAWAFAQRICGVCTLVHGIASVRAVEDALQLRDSAERATHPQPDDRRAVRARPRHALLPPARARLGGRGLGAEGRPEGHLDAGAVASAATPAPRPATSPTCRSGVKTFVESGQLGIFANGYWGHPAYKLPPEANLMAVAHYLDALAWQRDVAKLHAIFGGKNPHPHFLVGGVPSPIDLESDAGDQRRSGLSQVQDIIAPHARVRRPGLRARTRWPSPASTRTGRRRAKASATSCATATSRRRRSSTTRRASWCRAA